jgi:hypothetical protein
MTIMEGRARDWERPDFGGYRTGPKRICENADRRLGYLPIDYRDFGPHRLLFKTVGSHRIDPKLLITHRFKLDRILDDILPTGFECGVLNGKVQPGSTVAIVGSRPVGLAATRDCL